MSDSRVFNFTLIKHYSIKLSFNLNMDFSQLFLFFFLQSQKNSNDMYSMISGY
jgi:hypothetical protein